MNKTWVDRLGLEVVFTLTGWLSGLMTGLAIGACWETAMRNSVYKEAVEAGAAEYRADQAGAVSFLWRTCDVPD